MRVYYQDDSVVLYHGDCREIQVSEVFDHVITDAPYDDMTHEGAVSGFRPGQMTIDFPPIRAEEIAPLLLALGRRWVMTFCSLEMLGGYQKAAGEKWVRSGFWRRTNGAPQFTGDRPAQPGEGLAIMRGKDPGRMRWNGGGRHAYFEHPIVIGKRNGRVHPTQKPESLMREVIELFTDPGESIYDPFSGSGTTLLAAKALGRKAVGVEVSEEYCEHAAERLGQGLLFG